jgi:hypothetical protein
VANYFEHGNEPSVSQEFIKQLSDCEFLKNNFGAWFWLFTNPLRKYSRIVAYESSTVDGRWYRKHVKSLVVNPILTYKTYSLITTYKTQSDRQYVDTQETPFACT